MPRNCELSTRLQLKIPRDCGYLTIFTDLNRRTCSKYLAKLAKIFSLSNTEFRFLEVLVQIDLAKTDKGSKAHAEALARLKEELSLQPKEVKSHFASYVLLSEIFCALSLFGEPPTQDEILQRFSHRQFLDVQSALAELEQLKVIERDPKTKTYRQLQNKVSWIQGDNLDATIKGIEEIYKDGILQLPRFFPSRDLSFYNASIVSTDWAKFLALLPKLREEIYRLESEIESNQADSLVRFNVQVYPVTLPSSKKS